MEWNRELLLEKASDIKRAQLSLLEITSQGIEKFLEDPHLIAAAKYELIISIEAAISICNHINAKVGERTPETYADCFILLAQNKIINPDLGDRLAQMAKFRNLLVHVYSKVDDKRVYQIITENTSDLEELIKELGLN
ncbi:MAG: DUF86 domain-containing protein [Methanobacteriaceae archaeon]|nr:DUF86 domain-containing protein [Methanobacteriaceae archaeon]